MEKLFIFVLLLSNVTLVAQESVNTVDDYLKNGLYQGQVAPKSILFSEQKFVLLDKLREEFNKELTDKDKAFVSSEMNFITSYINDVEEKKKTAKFFLKNHIKRQTSNTRLNIERLRNYPLEVFEDEEVLQLIEEILQSDKASNYLLLICGYTGNSQFIPLLEKYAQNIPQSIPERSYKGAKFWKARLALARLGDENYLTYVIEHTQKYSDLEISESYMNDLSYLKKQKALDLILTILYSEETTKIYDVGDLPLSYAAVKKLRRIIPDLKLKEKRYRITKEDLEEIRIYFKSNSDIEFDHTNFW